MERRQFLCVIVSRTSLEGSGDTSFQGGKSGDGDEDGDEALGPDRVHDSLLPLLVVLLLLTVLYAQAIQAKSKSLQCIASPHCSRGNQ